MSNIFYQSYDFGTGVESEVLIGTVSDPANDAEVTTVCIDYAKSIISFGEVSEHVVLIREIGQVFVEVVAPNGTHFDMVFRFDVS